MRVVFLNYAKTITPNIIPFGVNKQLVFPNCSLLLVFFMLFKKTEKSLLMNFNFTLKYAKIFTGNFLDPAMTPECKVCAVRIETERDERRGWRSDQN